MTNPELTLFRNESLEQAKTEIPDLDPGALQLFLDVRDTPPIVEKGGINPGLYFPNLMQP